MRTCSLCKKAVASGKGSFFKAPKDENRRARWSAICQMEFTPTSIICGEHFDPAQIIRSGCRSLLMPSAVPILPSLKRKPIKDKSQLCLPDGLPLQLQEEPIKQIPIISKVCCTQFTQTNTRLCGLVQASDYADEFRFNCFYCSEVFPLKRWKRFVTHLKIKHFEMEEAFKIPKYVSEDHDYTPICLPSPTRTGDTLESSVISAKSLLPVLVDPLKLTHNSSKYIVSNSAVCNTPNEVNKEASNNIHFIEASPSLIPRTVHEVPNRIINSQNEAKVTYLSVNNQSTEQRLSKRYKTKSKSKLMTSGILHLKGLKQQTSKKTILSRCLKRTNVEEIMPRDEEEKLLSVETVRQKPTEITFEYTPGNIVDLLLDCMKNYPILWQFNEEPFNEVFYEAVDELCKIINNKCSLGIDNLRMRRSINRILRFYCYLYPNANVENIDQFTYYYDKCASFLPSSVNEIAYARCFHCYLCYRNDFDLKRHLLEEQKFLQWPNKCVQCKECFRESDEYEFHKRLSHYDEIFRCEPCNKTFTRRNIYNRHIVVYHPKDENERGKYKCNMCDKAYKTSTSLRTHKIIHGERKYRCHLCPKAYFVNARLTAHLKSHRKEYDYICEVCAKGFTLQKGLMEHMKKHTGAKVTCSICNLKLRKSSLGRHLRLVHVAYAGKVEKTRKKPKRKKFHYRSLIKSRPVRQRKETKRRQYHCKICNISFEKYKLIVEHNKDMHYDIPKWPCQMCSTEFSNKLNLKRHYRRKHNFHVIQAFKLVDENEDLNVVLAMEAEHFDELAESQINYNNEQDNVTETPIKLELLPGEMSFEEEKIHMSTIQDQIMDASDNVVTQEIKIDYMNDFFTDLLKEHHKNM